MNRYLKAGALTRCLNPLLSKGMAELWMMSGMMVIMKVQSMNKTLDNSGAVNECAR